MFMVVTEDELALETPERIGRIDFSVRRGVDSPESPKRREERAEALAALLFAQWQLQNAENN
jgi:hypothetical protein